MAILVSLCGLLLAGLASIGLVQPTRMVQRFEGFASPRGRWFAVGIRAVLGGLFLIAAPECRLPEVVRIGGIVALVAAAVPALMPTPRFESSVRWALSRPPAVHRVWFAMAAGLGALIVYAGA
jgi:hypothetical protein